MRKSEQYGLRPTKGETHNNLLYIAVDAVQQCQEEGCPVFSMCPYEKDRAVRCAVEMKYIEAVIKSITDMIRTDTNQLVLNKITLHLLPLFQQLVRFQIEAYAVRRTVYTTVQGQYKVHPIFKEIRETIKAIEGTQKSLGIDGEYIQALEMGRTGLRTIGQETQKKGYAETDFRDRWNNEAFKGGLGLRDPEEKPRFRRIEGGQSDAKKEIESEEEDAGSMY
jgi:hypothetical protein